MSHISVRPLSEDESDLLESLFALAISGTNQGIAKISATSFENRTFSGGGGTVGPGTINEIAYFNSATTVTSLTTTTYPSLTEFSYVKGLTSSAQTQINTKAADSAVVHNTGNETIAGIKTFSTPIAAGSVATMTATVGGGVPTPPNNTTTFLRGDGTFATPAGTGDMVLASAQTNSGVKTFLNTTMKLRNVANTFDGYFVNTNTADRIYTLKDAAGTLAFVSDITGTNSGTNTGDQTITLTGGVTGSGTGSFAATVITNANLTGHITSVGNAAVLGSFTKAQLNTAVSDGDVVFLDSTDTITGVKTMTGLNAVLMSSSGLTIRNPADTFKYTFTGAAIAADRVLTLPLTAGTLALTSDITGTNSGTNTGDQNIFQTIAIAGQSNVVADTTTDTLTLVAGTGITMTTDAATDSITINATASSGVAGTLNVNTTGVGNIGVGEDDLITYSVAGSTLSTNGDYLTAEVAGNFATSLNNKRLKVYFGTTMIFDSGSLAITAATDWKGNIIIIRKTATTFTAGVELNTSSATLAAYADYSTGTETLANALTLKMTGEGTANDDVRQEWMVTRVNSTTTDALSAYAPKASPTFTGTVTMPTPFTLGATSVTSTGTQLNYLNGATGTTGTTTTNLVFSTSPTLTTPAITGLATGSGVASAATVSTLASRDANGNSAFVNVLEGYTTTATAAGTTTLTVASNNMQYFTGVTTQTVTMPVTSTLVLGQSWWITNLSTGAVTINSSGGNAIVILAAGTAAEITCILTSGTDAASWNSMYVATTVTTAKKLSVSNTLTLAGTDATTMTFPTTSATIARTDAAQTFTGVQTFTAPILGTPTSATLTNATGLPLTGLVSDTTTALGIGSINLGHATDTTITRASAGAVSVEGIPVLLAGSTTVGQIPRITGTNTYAWGALDLADTDAVTGLLPIANIAAYTKTINMMQHVMVDSTGDAFYEPYSILATNDNFRHAVLRMGASNAAAPTVKSGFYGLIHIPEDYKTTGTVTCEIYWTSTITTGNVVFDLDYRSVGGDDTTSLDQATYVESLTVTDTAPGAANRRMKATVTLTASNLAAGDTLEFFFGRDGVDAADTMAGSALVHEVILKYTT